MNIWRICKTTWHHEQANSIIGEEWSCDEGCEAHVPEASYRVCLNRTLHSCYESFGLDQVHDNEVDGHDRCKELIITLVEVEFEIKRAFTMSTSKSISFSTCMGLSGNRNLLVMKQSTAPKTAAVLLSRGNRALQGKRKLMLTYAGNNRCAWRFKPKELTITKITEATVL